MNNASRHKQKNSLVALIRRRLLVVVCLLTFALLFNFLVSIYDSNSQHNLGGQKIALQEVQNGILIAMINQETDLRGYIATNNPTFLASFKSGRSQYLQPVQHLKDQAQGSDFGGTNITLAQVEARANDWYTTYAQVQIENMQAGKLAVARSQSTEATGKALFDKFRASVEQLQQAVDHDLNNVQQRIEAINLVALVCGFLLSGIAIFILWQTFIRFTRVLLEELNILKTTTNELGSGDLSAHVQELTYDELNELGQTFNTVTADLQRQQSVFKDRDIQESVLQLNAILASSLDFETLTQEFLNKILVLNDLQLVALYLYDPKQKLLKLAAAQGLDYREAQQEFKLGEGVVGQTGLNRQPVQIIRPESDEAGGFTAKTILGVVLPASFYHLPLLHGNELLGVLGVGSIYTMNEKSRNVLNVVAGILAVAISNSRAYQYIQTQANSLAIRSHEQERINAELRFQREEMTTLNSALEESNRARSQFHSTMSHELRTPLTSIIGFSQILLDGTDKAALNQQQRANLERILRNGKHLLVLINDVLDLAKIEAGHMGTNDAQVDVRELLTSVVEQTSSIALARNLVLSVEVAEGIDFIESDALKLRQILLNLVSNALKFTEKGGVMVSARCVLSADTQIEHIALAVQDTGMGIPADIQEHVFEAFYQADGSSTRKSGGTGLGLSIVSQLTALLGGKIEVKSATGQGSTFTLLLPSRAAHHEQGIPRLHPAQEEVLPRSSALQELPPEILHELFEVSAKRETTGEHNNVVLVIDDNPDNVVMIEAALQDTSYTVVGLQDPLQAMDMVRELQPCVITLDVMMPNLNGWQVLHQLKTDPQTAAIPVIMLTALSERTTGYVLGADDYLMKPFKSDVLLTTLQRLVPTKQNSGSII